MSSQTTTVVDRLRAANEQLGREAVTISQALVDSFDGVLIVVVRRFDDPDLAPRKTAFAAAAAAANKNTGDDIALMREMALVGMTEKALANRLKGGGE